MRARIRCIIFHRLCIQFDSSPRLHTNPIKIFSVGGILPISRSFQIHHTHKRVQKTEQTVRHLHGRGNIDDENDDEVARNPASRPSKTPCCLPPRRLLLYTRATTCESLPLASGVDPIVPVVFRLAVSSSGALATREF